MWKVIAQMAKLRPILWDKSIGEGLYPRYVKRALDICGAIAGLVVLSPLFAVIALLVRVKLGSPIVFQQLRPGLIDSRTGEEIIFKMYKFRSMTNKADESGALLPDSERLTSFGKSLRSSSLDELPELVNILRGEMSFVGPRPQLVRDMTFMNVIQRKRHLVRPGLTGLAQVRGRNAISWDDKMENDLEYVKHVTFLGDACILFATFLKVFKKEGIEGEGQATSEDFGDYLLRVGAINAEEYERGQTLALEILETEEGNG
ncbi:sugar transferase [Adlercreutzia shanghongiae]|uniref:Sugar transferase n=1 Tax=Adlercreutzia shanghongiae TaxID=3111773 RepID=A0ABU6J0B2_9ACTN|nr:sugar transferase [Adlercreutzia sp. R22]MEC4295547.1 sugar transferase [Adlercreutzia sp. R22]